MYQHLVHCEATLELETLLKTLMKCYHEGDGVGSWVKLDGCTIINVFLLCVQMFLHVVMYFEGVNCCLHVSILFMGAYWRIDRDIRHTV